MRWLRSLVLTSAAMAGFAAAAGNATASELPKYGRATVRSVDGPGLLTLVHAKRAFRIALAGIDSPRPGECGADEATAALRGLVTRAPRRVEFDLVKTEARKPFHDQDGHYVGSVTFPWRPSLRDFAVDLVRAGWARVGAPMGLDGSSALEPELADFIYRADAELAYGGEGVGPRRGAWVRCGGLMHLPVSAPVPTTAATRWSIDANGITSQVGPLTLSPVLSPATTLTLRQVAALAPAEIVRAFAGCRAWLPSLQIRAFADVDDSEPCGDAPVHAIRSAGPEGAVIERGGSLGAPASALKTPFPLLAVDPRQTDQAGQWWSLSGTTEHMWAWRTEVRVDSKGTALAIVTEAPPSPPTG